MAYGKRRRNLAAAFAVCTVALIALNVVAVFRAVGIRRLIYASTTGQAPSFHLGINGGHANFGLSGIGVTDDVKWDVYAWGPEAGRRFSKQAVRTKITWSVSPEPMADSRGSFCGSSGGNAVTGS